MEFNLLEKMMLIKNEEEKKILLNIINQEKEKLCRSKNKNDLVRRTLLDFITVYNPLSPFWKDKTIIDFTKNLITFYDKEEDLTKSIIKLIDDKFKKPSCFKILTSFEGNINKEKSYIECCFKLILITKNMQYLLEGIKEYLLIDNILLIKKIKTIDLESPYSHVLVRNIINHLLNVEKELSDEEVEKMFNSLVTNLKNYYYFLCPKCFQILFVRYFSGKFIVSCVNGHNYSDKIKTIDQLRTLTNFLIRCHNCKISLALYQHNYLCFECDNIFCQKCAEEHKNICLKYTLCNLYNCAFFCRIHNKRYEYICYIC